MPSVRARYQAVYPEAIGRVQHKRSRETADEFDAKTIDDFMRELSREDAVRNMRSFLATAQDPTLSARERQVWRAQYDLRRRIIAARDFLGWEFADANPQRVLEAMEMTP